jgi:transcription initiation factor TFIIIB Brf1 subunit/transcription initiation factor TFIIB
MVEITKVPPLKCPQCGSDKIKPGFNKRVRRAYIRDGRIWCYDCGLVTDKNGKAKKHKYRAHDFVKESE